jgi:uncharacterized protein
VAWLDAGAAISVLDLQAGEDFAADWEVWHKQHESRFAASDGFATPGSLHILFTDATSGVTTYAANRSLRVQAPDADSTVTLDFNRATNLPCAYTDFATCPLPPAGNRLPVAVEAGEQIPHEAKASKA